MVYNNVKHYLLVILFAQICRLDETLKSMNTDSMSKSPAFSGKHSGRQSLGELVNPNIMQSAPEVCCTAVSLCSQLPHST